MKEVALQQAIFLEDQKKTELENWKPSVDDWENHSKGKCSRDTVSPSIKEKKKEVVIKNLKDLPSMNKLILVIY